MKAVPGPEDEKELKDFYRTSDAYLKTNLASHGEEYFAIYLDRISRYVPKGSHVLDLGCGTGVSSSLLAKRGYRVTGTDLSEKFLDMSLIREGMQLVPADAHALPFPASMFDAVASYEFIEHVYDVPSVLDEMIRVTKPGGTLIVLSPNLVSPFLATRNLLCALVRRKPVGTAGTGRFEALWMVMRNSFLSVRKLMKQSPEFLYRSPDLGHPDEADADAVYLANQVDIGRYLQSRGLRTLAISEGHSGAGVLIAKLFPWASGECGVVARREGS